MTQALERIDAKDYGAIAAALSDELAQSAVERDLRAGIPDEEVQRLRDTGLLTVVIPKEYGGGGLTWAEAFKLIQTLSQADGSIGQLYGNHLNLTTLAEVSGTSAQAERYYRETVEKNLFWGNAINTRDERLQLIPEGDHFRANGIKSFGTGVIEADYRVFSAVQDGVELPILFVIPKDREGLSYNDDWDNIGQRRTASGSFTFNNVLVTPDDILGPPPSPDGAFATFLGIVAQLTKTYVYLGIAKGAFKAAKAYTTTQTRPWITSGVDSASKDPYILHTYGELWIELKAAIAYADKVAQQVQAAWEKGDDLTHQERGEVAVAVSAAKALASKTGLNIVNRIFEVTGTRSTATKYGFDRYWRDLRTFTLHDPVDYKLRDIGNWVLNHELPAVTQYS
ncbi:MAG TPA: acyl-CoA dehydrogenase family protein [Crinalium sp.]|jgi:alkylation response protein AidB-like acyl-CoA dehydrogenase